jgi:chromosome segregation ATPase
MFHQGDRRFRAWLTASARALPQAPKRLGDEIRRKEDETRRLENEIRSREDEIRLGEDEIRSREAEILRLVEANRLQAERTREIQQHLQEVLAYVESLESDRRGLLHQIGGLEADRKHNIERVSTLEAALEADHLERERWLQLLPGLRLRVPGGRSAANRLRALRRRLPGGAPGG